MQNIAEECLTEKQRKHHVVVNPKKHEKKIDGLSRSQHTRPKPGHHNHTMCPSIAPLRDRRCSRVTHKCSRACITSIEKIKYRGEERKWASLEAQNTKHKPRNSTTSCQHVAQHAQHLYIEKQPSSIPLYSITEVATTHILLHHSHDSLTLSSKAISTVDTFPTAAAYTHPILHISHQTPQDKAKSTLLTANALPKLIP